jgi:ribosome-associated translation inhibitor RaiA
MLIDVRTHGFEATDAILQHTRRRISSAVSGASRQVTRVTVRLGDINGDHGGVDKLCRIVAQLRSLRAIVVEAVRSDLYAALDHAAQRLKRAIGHHLGRRRVLRRGGPHHGLAAG